MSSICMKHAYKLQGACDLLTCWQRYLYGNNTATGGQYPTPTNNINEKLWMFVTQTCLINEFGWMLEDK